jgi:hypothetical protein
VRHFSFPLKFKFVAHSNAVRFAVPGESRADFFRRCAMRKATYGFARRSDEPFWLAFMMATQ